MNFISTRLNKLSSTFLTMLLTFSFYFWIEGHCFSVLTHSSVEYFSPSRTAVCSLRSVRSFRRACGFLPTKPALRHAFVHPETNANSTLVHHFKLDAKTRKICTEITEYCFAPRSNFDFSRKSSSNWRRQCQTFARIVLLEIRCLYFSALRNFNLCLYRLSRCPFLLFKWYPSDTV